MLGHKLWQVLAPQLDTYVTLRQDFPAYAACGLFEPSRSICEVDAQDLGSVEKALAELRPDVVVNCIGAVKQSSAAKDPLISIAVNSLFPHQLAELCRTVGSRLIHISTDCVFSGRKGRYAESDLSDAEDLYGRTKYLGEASGEGCLTIRTSMVGRELRTTYGLIEWFLSQEGGTVHGFTRAIFSGLTTLTLADIIARIILERSDLSGIWHVASDAISKHDLLCLVKEILGLEIQILPDENTIALDRSLNGERFRKETGVVVPAWKDMITGMVQDPTPYAEIRRAYVEG
jgi:dTDP-4-dehydrorhamnose reductase